MKPAMTEFLIPNSISRRMEGSTLESLGIHKSIVETKATILAVLVTQVEAENDWRLFASKS